MSKRRIILLLLASGLLVVGAVSILTRSREPSYAGHKLRAWVVEYGRDVQMRANQGRDPALGTDTASEEALRRIGTNAVPWLLRWIRYEQPRWKAKLLRWLNNRPPLPGIRLPVEDNQEALAKGAMRSFAALGSQGKGALPELTRLLNSPGKTPGASRAGPALAGLGPEALPGFLSALTNPDPGSRFNAAFYLQDLGTNALVATPKLVVALTDPDLMVSWAAAQTLGMLKADPPMVVPRLQALLTNDHPRRRIFGAQSLAHYGSLATSAVPALLAAMQTTNQSVQFWSREAILKIDPKALPDSALP